MNLQISNQRRKNLLSLFIITALAVQFFSTPLQVVADYVSTSVNRVFIDPSSISSISDGYQNGDEIAFILETTPKNTAGSVIGVAAWSTAYIPAGVEVIGAELVQANGDGTYSAIPSKDVASMQNNCGERGCVLTPTATYDNGSLARSIQDTGIFYSTDTRTKVLSSALSRSPDGGAPLVKPQNVWNQWDADQLDAFGVTAALSGNGGTGNNPIVKVGGVWFGTGSPVAGTGAFYTNDYNPACGGAPFESDIACAGPWKRIQYTNAKIAGSGAVAPESNTTGAYVNYGVVTTAGYALSPSNPLPAGTNAIRFVQGRRQVGDLELARVKLRITDSTAFLNDVTGASTFCMDAVGGDADLVGRGGHDNAWRYYEGNPHICFIDYANATILTQAKFVNGVANNGSSLSPGDVVGYEITFFNTSASAISNIVLTDTPANATLVAAGTSGCPYSSYSGNQSGAPTISSLTGTLATWNSLPTLAAGQSVTVHVCAQVGAGAAYGTLVDSAGKATFTGNPVGGITSTARGTVTAGLTSLSPMTVTKSASPSGTVSAGNTITYTVNVQNNSGGTQNNVVVADPLPAGTTYVSQSTSVTRTTLSTYLDQFATAAYNNSNGTNAWSSSWVEGGADSAGSATGGTTLITGGVLRFLGSAAASTLTRTANLSGATSAYLTFSTTINGTIEAGDIFTVEVFNGTSWTTLDTYDGTRTTGAYAKDITAYINAGTQIRFTVTGFLDGTGGSAERIDIDNVQIAFGPGTTSVKDNIPAGANADLTDGVPGQLVLATDNYDLLFGESLAITYQVTVNTPVPTGLTTISNTANVSSVEQLTLSRGTKENAIDDGPPVITVNTLTTNDTTPPLTGTVNDNTATISVTVNGNTYPATNNGNGTWTLANNTISPALAAGTYNVTATATDTASNVGTDSTTNELVIDLTAPTITVNSLTTNDTTPPLTGTVNDNAATISVTVNGNTYPATNNGDGTWTLANNTISPALAAGTYNVAASATDTAGNVGNDATTNELVIDLTAPTITVNSLTTNDTTPPLTGTVNDNTATISVTVNGNTYPATNNGNGTWTLANNTISPALAAGTYNVAATATDTAGNVGSDATTNELVIDLTAPTITVNSLTTNDTTPPLTGTVNDTTATISITVNGNTYPATNNGNGTWTLANNTISPALAGGTYNVAAAATDPAGNVGNDATTNELVIDVTAPIITVNTLTTNDTTPPLTGTVNDTTASISITVNGNTYPATNNGNGTWTLANNTISPALAAGTYNVAASATDPAGNVGNDATTNELVIDLTAPTITVNSLTTNDTTPPLTGTVNDNTATISVTVNGNTYPATNNGNGTWTLANNTISPALAAGTYNVAASATDTAGNVGNDATTNELVIDLTAPTITVNSLTTNDTTPPLTGTVNDNTATISVTVNGNTYPATNNGNGTWTLANNTISPALAAGTYSVLATATDPAGNAGSDATNNELVIDLTAPIITVNSLTTNDTTPQLTGSVNDSTATIAVTVNGNTYPATNNGNGTWTLLNNTISPALAEGTYEVAASATDPAGNVGNDATSNELVIDTTAPVVTVNFLTTNDTTPQLTGSVDDATAVVTVTVDGNPYTATNNGDGTWTLVNDTITPALAEGTYEVAASATDPAGNTGTDATSNELVIDTTAPVVTVNFLTTNDTTPQLTGSVDDSTAVVTVTVDGNPYTATNNGDGTWTLANDTITPALAEGTYEVAASATDPAGNTGNDGTSNELVIDTTAPVVTVNFLTTNDTTPQLTGSVDDATAVVTVTVDGNPYTATNNGDGTWTLANDTITPALAEGTYEVAASATDPAGNTGNDATSNELVIDTTAPVVTVNFLTTNDTTPQLTGSVDDATAVVTVTVNGNPYTATNNGDGTWTLANDTITPALAEGTYEVAASATDSAGNTGNDATSNELVIDTTSPVVTVNFLTTNDTTPQLTGSVDDATAVVTVTVNGNPYTATNNGDGTWTLANDTITPALAEGTYEVAASATDPAGNTGNDATSNELVIDTTAPVVTVNFLTTNDTTPQLTGSVDDSTAVVTVTVNGNPYTATNNGDGTWTLPNDTIAPALAEGTYEVAASATDPAGNTGNDGTSDELVIDTTAPVVTVNFLTTNDTTPQLTGSVDDATAVVTVTVNGNPYTATNNGDGTWTLPNNTISPALIQGTYSVLATATDAAGNVGTDTSANELVIDTTVPVVSVNSRVTNDTTPQLTGSVNDPSATVRVTVNGNTYTAVNNGDGTWTLPDNLIAPPLTPGVYDVSVSATDPAGNVGHDATTNELTIDTSSPVVTINSLSTTDTTPPLTGTVNDPNAVVRVTVDGHTYTAINNGDGTWTLPDNTINPPLVVGTFEVFVTATDLAGNSGSDSTGSELQIRSADPDGELESPVFVKWNTYLNQWNFLELTDQGTEGMTVLVTLYNLYGEEMRTVTVTLAANSETDVDVNRLIQETCATINPASCSQFVDLDGNGLIDSYGLAKLVFQANNPNARLRGRLSNYRPDTGASTFSFAFERPLVNASQGVSYGASNTYDAQGLGHLVPNWSEVISLSPGLNGFTVNLYNQSGALIQTQHIALKELEERDIQAGHEILDPSTGQVVESVYQVEVIPDSITAKYLFSVARYSSNAGGGSSASAYNYAFALPGRPGAAGDVFGFITNETLSCGTVTNWVEIMNVTNTSMSHTVEFRDSDGVLRGTATETLAPHAQYHYNASAILPLGMTGTVRVSSPVIGAVVGESLIYIHECDRNSLQTAYMTRLYAPGRAAQSASANSYLQMDDELRVAVTVNTPVAVQWGISTFNGESSNGTLNIASFGSTRLALSGNPLVNFPAERYGLITLSSPTLGQYISEVTRIRRVTVAGQVRYDFVMPTLGR